MTNIDNLTAKIKKLLALSTSPNVHEAEAAMQKANDLMTEHQIAMSDVLLEDLNKTVTASEGKIIKVSETYRSFIRSIGNSAGKLFDATTVGGYMRGQAAFIYIGLPEDIKHSELLFHYLFDSWLSIVKEDHKKWKAIFSCVSQYESKKYKIAHGQGFAQALSGRAYTLVQARKQAVKQATGTALIIRKDQLIIDYLDEFTVNSKKSYKEYYNSGRPQGYMRGQEIPLAGAITETKSLEN